ncbi:protease Do [Prosthecochloris aestuarii DSM 271]|uniref:Protease Do n=1 Tax=Prosthecochloris aestuarii (strain DSM 271 / SK 413) TaxID=290512 RepID=B4S9B3_PROA2|nr:DegQ family serine endoprotease [Prosthecochloris aestuarii]ACF46583.1 protease Do [Prosthecochloris aestuarii DSM 271]
MKRKYTYLFLVLAGVLVGALAFSHIDVTVPVAEKKIAVTSFSNDAAASPGVEHQPIRSLKDLNEAFVQLAESATPSVVTIFTEKTVNRKTISPFDLFGSPFDDFFNVPRDRGGQNGSKEVLRGLGSGVVVSADGYILTNNHVVDNADVIYIRTYENNKVAAKVVGKDPKTDLAVIKADVKGLKPIAIGDSDALRVGEWVIAIGSPLGENLARTVTQGIVSAKGRANVGLADYEDFIQTDAAINPGNSGGPLVNINGELVGINTAIASRTGGFEGIGFAVPSNMAKKVMQSLISNGKVTRGWLGVTIQDVDENIAKGLQLDPPEGVLVGTVVDDGPAASAGVKTGDVIIAIDGKKVTDTIELRNGIAETPPGTTVKLRVWRNGQVKLLSVRLSELPGKEEVAVEEKAEITDLLGFSVSELTSELASRYRLSRDKGAVLVTGIDPSSKAYRAGLRQGDLILSVNKKNVSTYKEFLAVAGSVKKGDLLFLLIERQGSKVYFAFNI